jgi:RNA polymerase sigma-70 factor (ECF subfamily)
VATEPRAPLDPEALEADVRALLGAGDARGAATLVIRAYAAPVLRFLRTLLRDEEDAGDAFSHVAEGIWRGLPSFRGTSSLRTWVFRIARNAATNLLDEAWRRRGRRFETGEASALAEELRTKTVVRVERQRDALEKLRASLSADEQALLTLRIEQQLAWAEIAEILAAEGEAVSADTVQKRFERLKERLARLARSQGLLG